MESIPNLINCDWNCVRGSSFECMVHCTFQDESNYKEIDFNEFIGMDRATLLSIASQPDESSADIVPNCYVRLNASPSHYLTHIRLTSEAPKLEVFAGKDAEYLMVQFGQLLDCVDEMSIYLFEISLPKSTDKVALKFFPEKWQFWIIGLNLNLVTHIPIHRLIEPSINLQNVQSMLDASNVRLSDSAEKCKRFLSMHMKSATSSAQGPPKFADMMAFVNQNQIRSSTDDPSLSKISNTAKQLVPNNNEAAPKSNRTDDLNASSSSLSTINLVKTYLDVQLKESESRIIRHIDEQLQAFENRQQLKLDAILRSLEHCLQIKNDSVESIALD